MHGAIEVAAEDRHLGEYLPGLLFPGIFFFYSILAITFPDHTMRFVISWKETCNILN